MTGLAGLVMAGALLAQAGDAPTAARSVKGWSWSDPRMAVLVVLGSVIVLGGLRRLYLNAMARRAAERLAAPDVTIEEIEDVATYGREGLTELFRLLETSARPEFRQASGAALARLWAEDQLIVEEEKAIVTRGFEVHWQARKRYPRELRAAIPIEVRFGVPFLRDEGPGVRPSSLEWSYRIAGSELASLEVFSAWSAGPGLVRFALEPSDFPTNGPHRLVLQVQVRTKGLTDTWEHNLPHVPFSFEFDPQLRVDALLTMPDATRGAVLDRAVALEAPDTGEPAQEPRYLALNDQFALRDPPVIGVTMPLPCDLAHRIELEIEGIPGAIPAGSLVLSGQGMVAEPGRARFPIGPIGAWGSEAVLDRAGERRLRVRLVPDPRIGWCDPQVRSIWPEAITTDWWPVRLIRR